MEIEIENICRIEGHADLSIKVKNGTVEDVKLKIMENKRFFTQGVRGMMFNSVPSIVSRICGTCSIAHLTCCIESIEKAIGVEPTEQTTLLRKLGMYGLMIRDHAMHLYLFCLPDIFKKDSVLNFKGPEEEKLLKDAFYVKGIGNDLCTHILGRAVHPTFSNVGGFNHIPQQDESKELIGKLKTIREPLLDLIKIFYDSDFEFHRKTTYVALVNDDFSHLEGEIRTSKGEVIQEKDYYNHLSRVVLPYSQAVGYEFEGKDYMVGALARVDLNRKNLHMDTLIDTSEYLKTFPSTNLFHNNLAQSIEMLHCVDRSIDLLETMEFKQEKKPEVKPREGTGVGVIEAPRGTLYYLMNVNADGRIKYANLVIPTSQNQINMQDDIRKLVQDNLDRPKEYIEHEIKKLIRAYDPCMSCASHFLRIKWI